jgi:two-component system, NtrC family, sensor histidine kinase HydH
MPVRSFNFTRWFAVTSLTCVFAIALVAAQLISQLVTDRLLRRDAEVTMEFVQSVIAADEVAGEFGRAAPPARRAQLEDTFKHIAQIPDVIRANVYGTDRTMLLSTDHQLIGKRFTENEELEDSLRGSLTYESGVMRKPEHEGIDFPFTGKHAAYFIEIYVPIRDRDNVVGVVELYKTPDALSAAIHDARRLIWMSAVAGGGLLFAALFWIARRADRAMREQQHRLMQSETLAMVGEMAAAVAHAVRNPLAAIRSSAELAVEAGPSREQAEDIVAEVDRIEGWVRELLGFTRPISGKREPMDTNAVIRASLEQFKRGLKRDIALDAKLQEPLPTVRGDTALLGQVINSLLANAADAIPVSGQIRVTSRLAADGRHVEVDVADNGSGIDAANVDRVFKPFFTTKPRGLGLGLPLARRVLERYGGTLAVASVPGAGATFTVRLATQA